MRRRDQPRAANGCIVFCSCTLRIFAIVPTDMPSSQGSAQRYRRLKVGNLESSKRDHFRPDPVPFDRPLTAGAGGSALAVILGSFRWACLLVSGSGWSGSSSSGTVGWLVIF